MGGEEEVPFIQGGPTTAAAHPSSIRDPGGRDLRPSRSNARDAGLSSNTSTSTLLPWNVHDATNSFPLSHAGWFNNNEVTTHKDTTNDPQE